MKIAKTYLFTFLLILAMGVSGCFDHTRPDPTDGSGTVPPVTDSTPAPSSAGNPAGTTVGCPTDIPTEAPTTAPIAPSTAAPTTAPTVPTTVPTAPPTEPTSPWPDLEDGDFVRIVEFVPNARQTLRYATENNFTGQVIYGFSEAYLRFGTVKKLARVAEELEELGLGLLIWDGYRPVSAQQRLWDVCPDPSYVSPPGTGRQSHCRGIAVDVTLYDLATGEPLEMPSDFDEFSPLGDRDYSDCDIIPRENALILENAMKNAGFDAYVGEWWHFSDQEEYPVEGYFDPSQDVIWEANCNEFINLRATPGGSRILARISRGGRFQLLEWKGKYARVLFEKQVGWVNAAYMRPADVPLEAQLDTVEVTARYTYRQLRTDLLALAAQYPQLAALDTAGYSDFGREISVLRIGAPDAAHHVLLQGAIHGREHATAWLLMAMAETWLEAGGFEGLCIHILPMVNPDGVTISQSEALNEDIRWIYDRDRALGYTFLSEAEYARTWKANGSGVDVNRNFPAGWEDLTNRTEPSSQQYRGSRPFSAGEALALKSYTLKYNFDVTVSYHATGSLTYYEYGDNAQVNRRGLELARAFQQVSGYAPTDSGSTDAGGYKDWVIEALEIPSLTVEIGCADAPLHQRELYSAFRRNVRLPQVLAEYFRL